MKILKLPHRATVDDLLALDDKAELVNGQIVVMGGEGRATNLPKQLIWSALYDRELKHGDGYAVGDRGVFLVKLPNRESFCPDVSWFTGRVTDPTFVGAPALAVEIRSTGDYGLRAERNMAAKRAEYFAAGTAVVWDVDVLREQVIRVHRASDPETPTVYRRGEVAEAEPAVPGWRFPVEDLFPTPRRFAN
ncbi:MAG TPA: Uma2 family endonuclease [Longimicrobium sp.]|nr:Uma2 family endonuclease [Longimicrobium sp.]